MQSNKDLIVILGSGGTIAGTASRSEDNLGYRSAQLGIAQLVAAVPALAAHHIEAEQVAQIDSKDMGVAVWRQLVKRATVHLARPEVAGLVITHGTDTMEETAWLLHRTLSATKPVVLTGAMHPATSLLPDGPQNLLDAVHVASEIRAQGVLVAMAGTVHGAAQVQKMHSRRLDAFASPDAGPLALIEGGVLRVLRAWPQAQPLGMSAIQSVADDWPWVEIITSHAGARGAAVQALVRAGVRGLVIAGTGNGSLHDALHAALLEAAAQGVQVRMASRCSAGGVQRALEQGECALWPTYGELNAVKSRIELTLELIAASQVGQPPSAKPTAPETDMSR